jgi:acetyl-CoA acyltransferase
MPKTLARTAIEHTPVIVGYARTAFTKATKLDADGQLALLSSVDLSVLLCNSLIERSGIDPSHIEKVLTGCAFPEGDAGYNIARNVMLHSKTRLTKDTGGETLNKFCGSSLATASIIASSMANPMYALRKAPAFISLGVELMSKNPDMTGGTPALDPRILETVKKNDFDMAMTAENIARKYKISRQEQDEFALQSHFRAAAARGKGWFKNQIIPVRVAKGPADLDIPEWVHFDDRDGVIERIVDEDDCIQSYKDHKDGMKQLGDLSPMDLSTGGTVTAGNASPLTDGASGLLIVSEKYALDHGMTPLARIISYADCGCDSAYMGLGPVYSTLQALKNIDLPFDRVRVGELNEAFAAQSLGVFRGWEEMGVKLDRSIFNRNGGAIALGHPLGASGGRVAMETILRMHDEGSDYGVATMCIGGGMGISHVYERYQPR